MTQAEIHSQKESTYLFSLLTKNAKKAQIAVAIQARSVSINAQKRA
jgi:hypothetical protein